MAAKLQSLLRIWLALLGLAFFVACSHAPQQLAISGETMGSTYHVRYLSANPRHTPERVKEAVDAVLVQVNAQMSTYDPDSELSRFNSRLQTTPVVISRALEQVVRRALEIADESAGALDVTVGPLVNLWGFGPQARPQKIPTDAELTVARQRVGYQLITLANHQMSKQLPELYIDLSTIAKGYGVDRVALLLEQLEIQNYLIEIGGEMRMKGSKPGAEPWRIAIEKPISTERSVQRVIELGDAAVATSGDYRNYYEHDGVRFSHIIDPHTGKPIQHNLVSVTVITDNCMDADAYATALTVMGPQRALEFAEQKQLAVVLITREADGFKELTSSAFARYLN